MRKRGRGGGRVLSEDRYPDVIEIPTICVCDARRTFLYPAEISRLRQMGRWTGLLG